MANRKWATARISTLVDTAIQNVLDEIQADDDFKDFTPEEIANIIFDTARRDDVIAYLGFPQGKDTKAAQHE